ncbi:hypothetical protein Mgra_00005580, partial [Meloidogyne graminicola]
MNLWIYNINMFLCTFIIIRKIINKKMNEPPPKYSEKNLKQINLHTPQLIICSLCKQKIQSKEYKLTKTFLIIFVIIFVGYLGFRIGSGNL